MAEETSGEIETLFQCKMCEYAGNSKDDIANHFIYTHASIEVIESPVKAKNSKDSGARTPTKVTRASSQLKDVSIAKEKIVKQTRKAQSKQSIPDETRTPSPSGRPQRKRRAPKWMEESEIEIIGTKKAKEKSTASPSPKKTHIPKVVIKVEVEDNQSGSQEDENQDEKQEEGRGGDQQDEEEDGGIPANEEEEPVETNDDDMEYNPEDEEEQEECGVESSVVDDNNDKVDTTKGDSDAPTGDNDAPKETGDIYGSEEDLVDMYVTKEDSDVSKETTDRSEEDWVKLLLKQLVPITVNEFGDKVEKGLAEWEAKWNAEQNLDLVKCSKPNCNVSVYKREESIHESCHMRDYQGFECIYCDERYSFWKQMRKHIGDTHKTQKDILRHWKCNLPKCSKLFKTDSALKKHVRSNHVVPEVGQSVLASFALSQLDEDGKPKKRPVGRPKSVKVKGPGRPKANKVVTEDTEEKPPKEKRVSVKWMPTCGKCAAVYDTTDELDEHISLHVVDELNRIACSECKEYFHEGEIREHMKKEHRRVVMPFRCVLCEFSSSRRHDVKKHMFCHEGFKRFQCSDCGKMMSTPYNLKIHQLRVHASDAEKNILCSLCGFKCANRAVLKDHMRHKHDLTMTGHSRSTTSKAEYPTFPCTHCHYVGKKETSLKYHMRIHEEDRPFKCNLCPYASKTKNNLILHVRTHKGMAPHKCSECEFRGATTLIVKEHIMAKHAKIKPLQCSVCDWSTCYNGNMWKHMQMHKLHEGILVPGKPKRATRKGIRYESSAKRFDKLLPITIDGFEVTSDEEQAAGPEVDNTGINMSVLPISIGRIGEGGTIVMVPGVEEQQQVRDEDAEAAQMVSFRPGEPQVEGLVQQDICFEYDHQKQTVDGSNLEEQEVMISVSGSDDQNIQQSISSIITSMAASAAAAANTQPTPSTQTHENTLIETQLSASEVASHFEDGTIIEITQIATNGQGTALIPEGAIVEKITPGMSASDIIMKAANMVASGQVSRAMPSNYQYTFPIAISKDGGAAENTLPFLAHVATAQESLPDADTMRIVDVATAQESLPDADTMRIVDVATAQESLPDADTMRIVEQMEAGVATNEGAVEDGSQAGEGVDIQQGIETQGEIDNEAIDNQQGIETQGEIVEQFVATILPDENNVMQIMQPQTQVE
ncbi:uncharacterized protein [Amphiura filiformis]|uniref:uncharacterized protein n=1 Tax=Amphiura filiformis TaxID=82378 RepID=UPI003B218E33